MNFIYAEIKDFSMLYGKLISKIARDVLLLLLNNFPLSVYRA